MKIQNWEFSNSRIPVLFSVSEPSPTDPSDLLRSLTIGSDPSDPFRSLRSLRSLRSVPIPLIRVISSTHTLPISVLSLPSHANHCEDKFHQRRALGDARRNLYSRERALKSSKVRALGNLNLNFEISNLLFAAQAASARSCGLL